MLGRSEVTITIAENIEVKAERNRLYVIGPKGEVSKPIPRGIKVVIEEKKITLIPESLAKEFKAKLGLLEALLRNMTQGVQNGYEKGLELVGVGFRASVEDNKLKLIVGYSHPVEIKAPEGITLTVAENTKIKVTGIDKELVGQLAAKIRDVRRPEPYKGKGIKYQGEIVKRKPGKAVKATTAE